MKIHQLINNEIVLGDGPSEKIINPFNSEIIVEVPQSSMNKLNLPFNQQRQLLPHGLEQLLGTGQLCCLKLRI